MIKFRPIAYSDDDIRAFKYTGTNSIREGSVCVPAVSSSLNVATCTPFTAQATLPGVGAGTVAIPNTKIAFLVYREDPDIENVGATIAQNEFVLSFPIKTGNEFEVHETCLQASSVASFAQGSYVAIATSGKLTVQGGTSSTDLIVGVCIGTFNSLWLRVRMI